MATDTIPVKLVENPHRQVQRIAIIDERPMVASAIAKRMATQRVSGDRSVAIEINEPANLQMQDTLVFSPLVSRPRGLGRRALDANVEYATAMIRSACDSGVRHLVLLSSAEVYGSDFRNPGMVGEDYPTTRKRFSRIASNWAKIESIAVDMLKDHSSRVSILRSSYILHGDDREFANRFFRSRFVFPLAGYDPCIQLLSLSDFVDAVCKVVDQGEPGIYNVAPSQVICLRKANQAARNWRIPIPAIIQRIARSFLAPIGAAEHFDQMEYLRFPWTVSGEKLQGEVDFTPVDSSEASIHKFLDRRREYESTSIGTSIAIQRRGGKSKLKDDRMVDDFGMDEQYLHSCSRWRFAFLEKLYWRIETEGLENVPSQGGAVFAGIHRGFMPLDGVMLVHLLSKYTGRIPRFLIHPGLVKHPHLSGFLTRIGGIIACQENANRILKQHEILGVFPEGIRGAFRMYNRDIYKIGKHRDDYIRSALRHRVPIIPFVSIGPAESFPILGKIESSWWKKHTLWPFIPLTPTANLVPLPTKWHIRILDPIPTEHLPHDAACIQSIVHELSQQVQQTMQSAIEGMLSRRKSIFHGTVFERSEKKLPEVHEPRFQEFI
ncbi:MAG: 1-acyl-sn-glycerol-3-phosphate acyltransferase [Pirellula sp.]